MSKYDEPKADHEIVGTWHIYEMELWDEDYFNMDVQAYIEVRSDFHFVLPSWHQLPTRLAAHHC